MEKNLVIPSHIQIETVAGICNYRCIMCPIEESIRNGIMDNKTFEKILLKLQPYLCHQRFLSLCSLGEPLIDKKVSEKIRIAKRLGFRGTGIYTNGELLTEEIAARLLDAGLDTLIISIDGFTSEVQAAIRVRSHLERVVSNVEQFIALREKHKSKTRVMIRFIRQELNKHQEGDFHNFWKARIKDGCGDTISIYNVHNSGRKVLNFMRKPSEEVIEKMKGLKCPEIYERLEIALDGSINFCCGDQFGYHQIGNILDSDLAELYNSPLHISYRKAMDKGHILDMELCRDCTVAYSIATRAINRPDEPILPSGSTGQLIQIQ